MAVNPVSTPTLRFICPTASTDIWASPTRMGTAKYWNTALRVPPVSRLPPVVLARTTNPTSAITMRVKSVPRRNTCARSKLLPRRESGSPEGFAPVVSMVEVMLESPVVRRVRA